jgi:hypothetical protein
VHSPLNGNPAAAIAVRPKQDTNLRIIKMITSTYENNRLEIYVNNEFSCSYDDVSEQEAEKALSHFKFMHNLWN